MDLFKEVGEICRQLDEFLEIKRVKTGRLERAGADERRTDTTGCGFWTCG